MGKITDSPDMPKPRATADLRFDNKAKIKPQGFNDFSVNDVVTVTITGKIKSVSEYQYEDGGGDKNLSVRMTSCVIGKGDSRQSSVGYQSDKD